MELEELLNILKISNLKSVSRDTGIPNDRMYKWKQGKGNPKKEDFDTLVAYFKNGTYSDKSNKEELIKNDSELIASLKETIQTKERMILLLERENEDLRSRLNHYEGKPKTGTN